MYGHPLIKIQRSCSNGKNKEKEQRSHLIKIQLRPRKIEADKLTTQFNPLF
jgi:hypothetical protein